MGLILSQKVDMLSDHDYDRVEDIVDKILSGYCKGDQGQSESEPTSQPPPPEKEALVGAAYLEMDALFDNIESAVKRRTAASIRSDILMMNIRTMKRLESHIESRPYGKGRKYSLFDIELLSCGAIKDGEFILHLDPGKDGWHR